MDNSLAKVLEFVFKAITLFKLMWILLFSVIVYLFMPEKLMSLLQSRHDGAVPPSVLQSAISLVGAFLIVESIAWVAGYIRNHLHKRVLDKNTRKLEAILDQLTEEEREIIRIFIRSGFGNVMLKSFQPAVINLYAKSVIYPITDTIIGEAYYLMHPTFRRLVQKRISGH